jgi:hypothetical protein
MPPARLPTQWVMNTKKAIFAPRCALDYTNDNKNEKQRSKQKTGHKNPAFNGV